MKHAVDMSVSLQLCDVTDDLFPPVVLFTQPGFAENAVVSFVNNNQTVCESNHNTV